MLVDDKVGVLHNWPAGYAYGESLSMRKSYCWW